MDRNNPSTPRILRLPRREFIKLFGKAAVGLGALSGAAIACSGRSSAEEEADGGVVAVYPVSEGYLLVDVKKCQGCVSCMLACSMVNEGACSLSLARLQVVQNPFNAWPDDLAIDQCRQCAEAYCVQACRFAALRIDEAKGNVRSVDRDACVGCGACVEACPFTPKRPVLASDLLYGGANKSRKCDLCATAPFHFAEEGGGPNGKQACVEICPIHAIAFTGELPDQDGDAGYEVNLRDETWAKLGFPRS